VTGLDARLEASQKALLALRAYVNHPIKELKVQLQSSEDDTEALRMKIDDLVDGFKSQLRESEKALTDEQMIVNDPSKSLKYRLEAAKNSQGIISEKVPTTETIYRNLLKSSRVQVITLRNCINDPTKGYKAHLAKATADETSLRGVVYSPTIGLHARLYASEEQVRSFTKQLQVSRDQVVSEHETRGRECNELKHRVVFVATARTKLLLRFDVCGVQDGRE
jgi:hypothetical protein